MSDSITIFGRHYEASSASVYLGAEERVILFLKGGEMRFFVPAPITWDEYVEWTASTAIYPKEQAVEYCNLGLLSELGEVAGKLKKRIRDGEASVPVEAVLAELGDVCWYLARLQVERGLGSLRSMGVPGAATTQDDHTWMVDALCSALNEEYHYVLERVEHLAIELGYSLPEVLEMNVEKLSSRKARGVLGGSGDER